MNNRGHLERQIASQERVIDSKKRNALLPSLQLSQLPISVDGAKLYWQWRILDRVISTVNLIKAAVDSFIKRSVSRKLA